MRLITGILLLLSLLVIPGNPAMCDTPAPPLQLQQAAPPAQGSPQADDIRDIKGPVPLSAIPGYLIPAAAAVALSPVSAAVASIFELFIVLGAFVVSVASVRAVTAAPF